MRVKDVLELLSAGASFEEILQDYPFLEREDIYAAIEYAALKPITPSCGREVPNRQSIAQALANT